MSKTMTKQKLNEQILDEGLTFLNTKTEQLLAEIDNTVLDNVRPKNESKRMAQQNFMNMMDSSTHQKRMQIMDSQRKLSQINSAQIPNQFFDEEDNEVSLEDIKPEEPEEVTLPANISKELLPESVLNIEWTDVSALPGNQIKEIRALGKAVFHAFGIDEKAPVKTISAFKDSPFLNETKELNAVLGYLNKFAARPMQDKMIQDFSGTIDNYAPEIDLYHTPTTAYLIVNEPEGHGFEGRYIYAFKRKQDLKLKNEKKKQVTNKP